MVLKLRSSTPISPTPCSAVRAPEVAGRQSVGHGRRAADRLHDGPGQVAGEHGDEHDRPAEADCGGGDGPLGGRVRADLAGRRQATLGRQEAVELVPDGVHALLALIGGGLGPGRRPVAPGRRHQRDRVVAQVGPGRRDDAPGPRLLLGVAPDQPLQGGGLPGEGGLGAPPRVQEAVLAGDDEPALGGLQVDDPPLQQVGDLQDLLGLAGASLQGAQVGHRGQQDREGGADQQREQPTGDQHATGQPAPALRCPQRAHSRRLDHNPVL
jgi:hypothetical protein